MSVIKLKRSHTASAVPTTLDLVEGEVALNTADQKLYCRNAANVVITVGGLYDGADLPTSDPAIVGAFWNDNGVLKVSAG